MEEIRRLKALLAELKNDMRKGIDVRRQILQAESDLKAAYDAQRRSGGTTRPSEYYIDKFQGGVSYSTEPWRSSNPGTPWDRVGQSTSANPQCGRGRKKVDNTGRGRNFKADRGMTDTHGV